MIVEVKAVLSDHPCTYLSSDVTNPPPLTPSHLIYMRRMIMLPHLRCEDDEVCDGDHNDSDSQARRRAKVDALLLKYFWLRWRQEYLVGHERM